MQRCCLHMSNIVQTVSSNLVSVFTRNHVNRRQHSTQKWKSYAQTTSSGQHNSGSTPVIKVRKVKFDDWCPVCLECLDGKTCAVPPFKSCKFHMVCGECYKELISHRCTSQCLTCRRAVPSSVCWKIIKARVIKLEGQQYN